ncbi:carbon-nitrogen hydrolase [Piptocephalis cylindrospora]|uniref:Carbon-nitrogen hydrolase n=1 Tax=Piptocephalis cylindrospora TaxID=1907219 RepID=A0A4P9Y1Q9_9FUNG|nr:carbon-nitrogen hydrolase [Piptocephalis cylindrospora]|eukprot:RKP12768.1 carbon-nitrogen hydrolase [Piptocephalis cylindrospora]
MDRVDQLLAPYSAGDMDLLVFPEMSFTGYMFKDAAEIAPFLEDARTGPTARWAKQQANRLEAALLVGFAERDPNGKAYNSAMLVYPDITRKSVGLERVKSKDPYIYHKHYLYTVDKTWASPGPSFEVHQAGLCKIGVGICMDLNFEDPFNDLSTEEVEDEKAKGQREMRMMIKAMEPPPFATYHQSQQTRLLLCLMNWIDIPRENTRKEPHSLGNLSHWFSRLEPLLSGSSESPVTFIACNRIGSERGTAFCGTSCILDLVPGEEPVVRALMRKDEEGCCTDHGKRVKTIQEVFG